MTKDELKTELNEVTGQRDKAERLVEDYRAEVNGYHIRIKNCKDEIANLSKEQSALNQECVNRYEENILLKRRVMELEKNKLDNFTIFARKLLSRKLIIETEQNARVWVVDQLLKSDMVNEPAFQGSFFCLTNEIMRMRGKI